MRERITGILKEVEKEVGNSGGGKFGWWDEECMVRNREVRKELREWTKRGGEGEVYKGLEREYKILCDRKKKEENEKWERRVSEASRESDIWGIINWERKNRKRVSERIGMEEWEDYFVGLLRGGGGGGKSGGQGEETGRNGR